MVFRDRPGFGSGRGDKGVGIKRWIDWGWALIGSAPISGVLGSFHGALGMGMGIGYRIWERSRRFGIAFDDTYLPWDLFCISWGGHYYTIYGYNGLTSLVIGTDRTDRHYYFTIVIHSSIIHHLYKNRFLDLTSPPIVSGLAYMYVLEVVERTIASYCTWSFGWRHRKR